MPPIYFASGNKEKVTHAQHICGVASIPFEQIVLDIHEIQGEDPVVILEAKARAAFETFGKPVVVSDDSWSITALNGFPGAYMKSINFWFKPDDFLRLMHGITDRSVVLHQYLAYYDGLEAIIFTKDVPGKVLEESFGDDSKVPWMNVVTMESDEGRSLAEIHSGPNGTILKRYRNRPDAWQELVTWYKEKYA